MNCKDCNVTLVQPKVGRKKLRCRECAYQYNLASIKRHQKQRHENLKSEVYKKLGNKCNICGENDEVVLQIDHINNDGSQDRKKFLNMRSWYDYILKHSPEVQLLCCNCNWRKEYYRRVGNAN